MIILDTNVVSELMRPEPSVAVKHWLRLVDTRQRLGRPIDGFDAQIASICRAHLAPLATRNVKGFQQTGIDIIDPWRQT